MLLMDWQEYVEIDPRYFRPTEAESLLADACKARHNLGWEPKVAFKELVKIMVDADMEPVGLKPIGGGRLFWRRNLEDDISSRQM